MLIRRQGFAIVLKYKIIVISVILIIFLIGIIVYERSIVYSGIVSELGTIERVTPKGAEFFIQSEDRETAFFELAEKYGIKPTESYRKIKK